MLNKQTRLRARASKPQTSLFAFLLAAGFDVEMEVQFGKYSIDIYCRTHNIAFEVDGVYWHSMPRRAYRDARRDRWLERHHGIVTIRLTDVEVKSYGLS